MYLQTVFDVISPHLSAQICLFFWPFFFFLDFTQWQCSDRLLHSCLLRPSQSAAARFAELLLPKLNSSVLLCCVFCAVFIFVCCCTGGGGSGGNAIGGGAEARIRCRSAAKIAICFADASFCAFNCASS